MSRRAVKVQTDPLPMDDDLVSFATEVVRAHGMLTLVALPPKAGPGPKIRNGTICMVTCATTVQQGVEHLQTRFGRMCPVQLHWAA